MSPFTMSSVCRSRFHLPVDLSNGKRNFMGNYIPPHANGDGLKLFLNNNLYTATSSSIGKVGATSLASRAMRRR